MVNAGQVSFDCLVTFCSLTYLRYISGVVSLLQRYGWSAGSYGKYGVSDRVSNDFIFGCYSLKLKTNTALNILQFVLL
jgi:hypothetical protein